MGGYGTRVHYEPRNDDRSAQPAARQLRSSRRCGLPKIRFHDLRHSAATLLRAAGIPTPAISKMLGHSSTRATDEVYSHVLLETAHQAAAKWMRLWSQ